VSPAEMSGFFYAKNLATSLPITSILIVET